jgi:hypothetical protein
MSGPLRFRTAAVLLAGLSTSPVSANIIDTLFNRAPEEALAPAPAKDASAKDECLSRPGRPADGQHWMYRLDGHRRCWFSVPEEAAAVRKRVHHHAVKQRFISSEKDEIALRRQKAVVDARAELIRPAAEDALQPRPVPAVKVVDAAAFVPATGAAALVPSPPVLAKPDQLPLEHPNVSRDSDAPQDSNVRQDNVETLLAATAAGSEAVAVSASPAGTVAVPVATGEDVQWWTSRWIGPLLMGLGLMSLLGAARPLRGAALLTRSVRAPEAEDRLSLRSDSDSEAHLHHRRHVPAIRHGTRPIAEHQRKSRPPRPASPDMTFHEAISLLTDFDAASLDARPGALTQKRLDAAPASGKTGAYVSRMS